MTDSIEIRGDALVSAEGWRIEARGPGEIRYRDGLVGASVAAEMTSSGPVVCVIYRSRIRPRWWSLKRRFSKADRGHICDRVARALQAIGTEVRIAR